jgi:sugar phosphate isomerase/epimerase
MDFCLSTHWNAQRHLDGQAMVEEILELGFLGIELGYDLTLDLVAGVRKLVDEGAVRVGSVHAFCPVPLGVPFGHPELFSICALDPKARETAVAQMARTIEFAGEMGARYVVVHAGYVEMRMFTRKLITLCEKDKQYSPPYERAKTKLMLTRDKRAPRHVDKLCLSVEALLPTLQDAGVVLAFENLPFWESVPTEAEMLEIGDRLGTEHIGYWHDLGHGQTRQNLGFIGHRRWLERLLPMLTGIHIHDCSAPTRDHLMPPKGDLDFPAFRGPAESAKVLVFEPASSVTADEIRDGVRIVREAWETPPAQPGAP